jgi:hypothetical protein
MLKRFFKVLSRAELAGCLEQLNELAQLAALPEVAGFVKQSKSIR